MIANIIAIHKLMVNREVRLDQGSYGYRPKKAHEKAIQRRYEKPKTHIPITTWVLVNDLIKQNWSLEQISNRLLTERGRAINPKRSSQHRKIVTPHPSLVAREQNFNPLSNISETTLLGPSCCIVSCRIRNPPGDTSVWYWCTSFLTSL